MKRQVFFNKRDLILGHNTWLVRLKVEKDKEKVCRDKEIAGIRTGDRMFETRQQYSTNTDASAVYFFTELNSTNSAELKNS